MRLKVSWCIFLMFACAFFLLYQAGDQGMAANIRARAKVKNDLPRVKIVAPRKADTVSGVVKVSAQVTDPAGLDEVRFYVGKDERFKDSTRPYTYSWDTRADRDDRYKLEVQAEYKWVYTAKDELRVSVKNNLSLWQNILQRVKNYWNKSKDRLSQVMPVIAVPFSLLTLFLIFMLVQRRIDRRSEKLEW